VTPKAKALVFGSSYPYQRNKFGAAADVYPSTRQYKAQLAGKGAGRAALGLRGQGSGLRALGLRGLGSGLRVEG